MLNSYWYFNFFPKIRKKNPPVFFFLQQTAFLIRMREGGMNRIFFLIYGAPTSSCNCEALGSKVFYCDYYYFGGSWTWAGGFGFILANLGIFNLRRNLNARVFSFFHAIRKTAIAEDGKYICNVCVRVRAEHGSTNYYHYGKKMSNKQSRSTKTKLQPPKINSNDS